MTGRGGDTGRQLLTFTLGEWTFGMPLGSVQEVQRAADIRTLFPGSAVPVAVMDLRGETLPVWNLRALLSLPAEGAPRDTFLIVTSDDPAVPGAPRRVWVVDAVTEVVDVSPGQPVELAGTPFDAALSGVLRFGPTLVFLLDPRRLVEAAARFDAGAPADAGPRDGVAPAVPETLRGEELVVFVVAEQRYALPVAWIREIQPVGELTRVPCVPDFVRGVMNLRGGLLSVIDLHGYMGVQRFSAAEPARVIVLDASELEVGFAAHEVIGLVQVAPELKLPSMPTPGGIPARFLDGMLADLTLVLNAEALLADPRMIIDDPAGGRS